jgi:heme/copper-type cytochrome/quinol oxidase subunit 2
MIVNSSQCSSPLNPEGDLLSCMWDESLKKCLKEEKKEEEMNANAFVIIWIIVGVILMIVVIILIVFKVIISTKSRKLETKKKLNKSTEMEKFSEKK